MNARLGGHFRGRLTAIEPQLPSLLLEGIVKLLPGHLGFDHRVIHTVFLWLSFFTCVRQIGAAQDEPVTRLVTKTMAARCCGGMSAFVVFSMMGFYPVTPGVPIYDLGSPIFNHITTHLENGRKLGGHREGLFGG